MLIKKNTTIIFIFLIIFITQVCFSAENKSEYQIKAAFIYKFLFFIEWPESAFSDTDDTITIGIMGYDPFADAFNPIIGKRVKNKTIVIKRFDGIKTVSSLLKCHILFISVSEKSNCIRILNEVRKHPILTVSDYSGFIEKGGIINFVKQNRKIRFEINNTTAEQAGIIIPSSMKRLAVKIK